MTDALSLAYAINMNVMLRGAPGVGKTFTVTQVAKAYGAHMEAIVLANIDGLDLGGTNIVDVVDTDTLEGDASKWVELPGSNRSAILHRAAPEWITTMMNREDGLLFFDEVLSADKIKQQLIQKILSEREVAGVKLPDTIRIFAAGNPPEMHPETNGMPMPLADRCLHIDVTLTQDAFADALNQGVDTKWGEEHTKKMVKVYELPKGWRYGTPQVREAVLKINSFIKARSEFMQDLSESTVLADDHKGRASVRGWQNVGLIEAACRFTPVDDNVRSLLITAAIGEGAAVSYLEWERNLNLLDPNMVLANPQLIKTIDRRQDIVLITCAALSGAVTSNLTPDRLYAAAEALNILVAGTDGSPVDLVVPAIRTLRELAEAPKSADLGITVENLNRRMPDIAVRAQKYSEELDTQRTPRATKPPKITPKGQNPDQAPPNNQAKLWENKPKRPDDGVVL